MSFVPEDRMSSLSFVSLFNKGLCWICHKQREGDPGGQRSCTSCFEKLVVMDTKIGLVMALTNTFFVTRDIHIQRHKRMVIPNIIIEYVE